MVQFTKRFEPSGAGPIDKGVCAVVKNFFLSANETPYLTVSVIHVPGVVHVPAEYTTTEVIPRGRGTKGRGSKMRINQRPRATQLRCKNAKTAWLKFLAKRGDTTKTPASSNKMTNWDHVKPLTHQERSDKLGTWL